MCTCEFEDITFLLPTRKQMCVMQ